MSTREIALQHWKLLIILIMSVAVLGFLTYAFVSPHGIFGGLKNDLKVIEPREESSYTDLDGTRVDLSTFKGKPLIINSWASWMPFSQAELALLTKIQTEYGDAIKILAINRMEQVPMIRSFLSTFGIPNTLTFLADPTDNFYKAIGGYAMPETVFYNSEGVLVYHKRGVLTEIELLEYTKILLDTK